MPPPWESAQQQLGVKPAVGSQHAWSTGWQCIFHSRQGLRAMWETSEYKHLLCQSELAKYVQSRSTLFQSTRPSGGLIQQHSALRCSHTRALNPSGVLIHEHSALRCSHSRALSPQVFSFKRTQPSSVLTPQHSALSIPVAYAALLGEQHFLHRQKLNLTMA